MNVVYIGIDPGKAGAICRIAPALKSTPDIWKMPATNHDLSELFHEIVQDARSHRQATFALLEFVRSSPQMGVTSSFTFGRGYGFLEGMLAAFSIPYEDILPRKWQSLMGCLTKGDKNVSKAKAQKLFPKEKVTNYNADALLIAECARRFYSPGSSFGQVKTKKEKPKEQIPEGWKRDKRGGIKQLGVYDG